MGRISRRVINNMTGMAASSIFSFTSRICVKKFKVERGSKEARRSRSVENDYCHKIRSARPSSTHRLRGDVPSAMGGKREARRGNSLKNLKLQESCHLQLAVLS